MWKRLNSNQMCEKFSYKEVFLIKRFLIERFYCIYIYIYILTILYNTDLGNNRITIVLVVIHYMHIPVTSSNINLISDFHHK